MSEPAANGHPPQAPKTTQQPSLFWPQHRPPYAGEATQTPGYDVWAMARWVPEPAKSTYRSDFERDRARILHSAALRRLRSEEHTSELQSRGHLVCRPLLE